MLWYNGQPLSVNETGYVDGYNRVVAGLELRQFRVGESSCTIRRFVQFGKRYCCRSLSFQSPLSRCVGAAEVHAVAFPNTLCVPFFLQRCPAGVRSPASEACSCLP